MDAGRRCGGARRVWRVMGLVSSLLMGAVGAGFVGGCGVVERITGTEGEPTVTARPGSGAGDGAVPRAVVPGIAGEPEIRVRLLAGTSAVRIGSTAPRSPVWASVVGSLRPASRLGGPVDIRIDPAGGFLLRDATGLEAKFDRAAEVQLSAAEPGAAAPGSGLRGTGAARSGGAERGSAEPMLTVNGKRYPGTLRLLARSDVSPRSFDVIEQVGTEVYLEGVVAAELFASWPRATFAAQAVAARSYALHERARARMAGQRHDVEASTADQAYSGASGNSIAAKAVAETRGVVLTWQGQVVRAYYSSTSGGRAASARDTWPTGPGFEYNLAGPIQAQVREDEWGASSPWHRWTVLRTRQEMTTRLKEWGRRNGQPVRNLTTLQGVRVLERNGAGRPSKFAVVQAGGGQFVLTAEQLRGACNQEATGVPPVTVPTRVHSGDMEWTFTGDAISIRGRGFGHGVGMCQWSAKEMAERGSEWQGIIATFYPGARVERAY